ncbi:mannitol dehydrogenase family protein [Naasia sp. SYSU D00948]|uniref:mannitol dehydrogenase family protein n=1 Tax=Naasia sp. SYSU D00948 TaxID=2817379 RepID=UPI0027DE9711|nr:mannitol dehydrogenase family protein [Naasia sp. SYSU D00948]
MSAVLPSLRLSRGALRDAGRSVPTPPVRIVHLGVGAFFRAHQVWYTAHSTDASDWGIVGFTGRSPDMADRLGPQDGLYTLVERGPHADRHEIIGNLVDVLPGNRVDALVAALSAPSTALVTLTITEVGYRLLPDGSPDLSDPAVTSDVDLLRGALRGSEALPSVQPSTALGRLLLALEARRREGAPPVALVSCDNIPDNGGHLQRGLTGLASLCSPDLADWLPTGAAFVSTSVDRITPRIDHGEERGVTAATGWLDAAPVITEPFSDWVLSGDFPSGRPAWETAGARFVDDIEPYEARKLWMLNGAHSLLAYSGLLRGHRTVADAMADPVCRDGVERLWDEDIRHLPASLDLDAYRAALAARFLNARIEHQLEQIATDALLKLRLRIVPVADRELTAGRSAAGCASAIAAWIAAVQAGIPLRDAASSAIADADRRGGAEGLLELVSPLLAEDVAFRRRVTALVREL